MNTTPFCADIIGAKPTRASTDAPDRKDRQKFAFFLEVEEKDIVPSSTVSISLSPSAFSVLICPYSSPSSFSSFSSRLHLGIFFLFTPYGSVGVSTPFGQLNGQLSSIVQTVRSRQFESYRVSLLTCGPVLVVPALILVNP